MRIKTDNKWHQFSYRYDVPADVLEDDFDYLDEDEGYDGFFKYKDTWYHLSDFTYITSFDDWDGVYSGTAFSGTLIKVSDDGEEYKVGMYFS